MLDGFSPDNIVKIKCLPRQTYANNIADSILFYFNLGKAITSFLG